MQNFLCIVLLVHLNASSPPPPGGIPVSFVLLIPNDFLFHVAPNIEIVYTSIRFFVLIRIVSYSYVSMLSFVSRHCIVSMTFFRSWVPYRFFSLFDIVSYRMDSIFCSPMPYRIGLVFHLSASHRTRFLFDIRIHHYTCGTIIVSKAEACETR